MKLLFDHHLSPSLVARLEDVFPDSEHVWNLALHDADDRAIWSYARDHGFIVVSKDADFAEISMESGFPPKLVWLRIGNWKTADIEALIRSNHQQIRQLPLAATTGILALFKKKMR